MVSRAEFAITAVFVFLVTTFGGIFAFKNYFVSATGLDGLAGEFGSNGVLWLFGVLAAAILIFMIKRNRK